MLYRASSQTAASTPGVKGGGGERTFGHPECGTQACHPSQVAIVANALYSMMLFGALFDATCGKGNE